MKQRRETEHAAAALPLDAEGIGRSLLQNQPGLARELAHKRPIRVCADVAACYAAILLAFTLLALHPNWWSAALVFVVVGSRQYALSVLAHEGSHRKLFDSRRLNDAFSKILLCAPVGIDFHNERQGHGAHHRLLSRVEDPDRYLYSVLGKATRLRFAFFLTGLDMFPRAIAQTIRGRGETAATPLSAKTFLARRSPTIAFQGTLFLAMWQVFPWWYYAAFWIAPMYPLMFLPHQIRRFCEHAQPVTPDQSADGQRLISFARSRLESWFISPYNVNLHAEHHLWPFVPYYNVPRLTALIEGDPRIERRSTYRQFLRDYYAHLPLPDRRTDAPVGAPAQVSG